MARAACWAVLAAEAIGLLVMWLMPFSWLWLGGRVYDATGSLGADLAIAFFGSAMCVWVLMNGLHRIDMSWVGLRRLAGYEQSEGMLPRMVVVSFTLGIAVFLVWWYVIDQAFVMPFMPS